MDKNGKEIKRGDIVKIEGGYFKADNGLFRVEHAPGDLNWNGKDWCLHRINKDYTPSKSKYSTAFWPLMATTNSYQKRYEAKRHNAEHATIEVINQATAQEPEQMTFIDKCEALAQKIGEQIHIEYTESAKRTYSRPDFQADRGKSLEELMESWEQNIGSGIKAVVIPGRKYTKIDVCLPQQSGRYMVVNETGEIYGIKAYGVIHKGYKFGTLDTIDQYYWGGYRAGKLPQTQESEELPEVVGTQEEVIASVDQETAQENPYAQPEIKDGFIYDCHFKEWNVSIDTLKAFIEQDEIEYIDMDCKLGFVDLTAEEARKVKEISVANGSILFIDNETPEPQQKQPRNNYTLDCGCTVHYKADINTCKKCGKQLCGSHIYFYVDESNAAITNHSPLLCRECYEAQHGPQRQFKRPEPSVIPNNVLDFTARLKAKQEQEATNKAIDKFKTDYLPYISIQDAQEIAQAQEEQQAGIIARICMRIDLERRVR